MFPAGHFYSPIPDPRTVITERDGLPQDTLSCPGVKLNSAGQLKVLEELSEHYSDLPFSDSPAEALRYYFDNPYFRHGDGIVLYGMLRRLRPSQVIEIGSGFSSALMLDIADHSPDWNPHFTFVEPYPARLRGLLTAEDEARCRIIGKKAQQLDLDIFASLAAGDILFIDSSHVAKAGSDVNHLFFRILPMLKPGVVIHFHDVFWPFEYPDDWLLGGNAWNEAYLLRAFLQYNSEFQIEYFNAYMGTVHREAVASSMPLCLENLGGSIWLRRLSAHGSGSDQEINDLRFGR
jgi:predicted O-methyltransferase YrrM